jgi:hypothetical protein
MLVVAFTMSKIVPKLSFINLSIFPSKLAPTMLQIIMILSFKLVSITRFPYTFTFSFALYKNAFKNAPVIPSICACSVELSL